MEPLNTINNKRKLKFNDRQNCNKKLKTHIQKDSDLIKYIIRCTENNTKLLEDLKYNFKSNEISDFTKRLKKYISKREKIERKFNNKYSDNKNKKNEEQIELSPSNNDKEKENSSDVMSSTLDKSPNSNPMSINFVFTDKKKNIKEILIIKPINEVKEIKYSYCQLDTTNRYIVKRIKKDNFVEAYNYDLDFRNFLVMNHQLFEENDNISNEEKVEKVEKSVLREKEILNNNDNRILLEHNNHYNNGHKKVNDTYNRNNIQINSENNDIYNNVMVENNHSNSQEATVVYANENHNNCMNKPEKENKNVANEEDDNDIPFPFFAKNSFGLLDEDEYNNHNNAFQNYFSSNINEKYKIVYGKEIPSNLNEFDDGNKENNNPHNTVSDNKITKNSKNMKAQKNRHLINNNISNNNNMLDSEIETFRAADITNKDNAENNNERNINVLKEVFNEENSNKRGFLSNNKDIYNDNSLVEISNEINNPVIDKIIKLNKNNKNSNKASSINKELYLDESSSISIPPSIETFEASLELQPNHNSKELSVLDGSPIDHPTKIIENSNNINSNFQNNTYKTDETKENDHSTLINSNKNENILEAANSNIHQELNKINIKPIQYKHIQNKGNDIIRQNYLKRKSDLKAYWPTFTFTYEDPSSKDFTTSIQKKSLFSPQLQYLILLNKELSKKNEKEKDEQANKDNMVGGYIVINKDIKGSWTNTEIMKYIKKHRVVNNELNLLIPLKCVIYDCSPYNKYVKKEKVMYYIRLYQKLNIENHTAYIDMIIENINSEDKYDYTLLFSVPVEAFEMYICKNEEEINYHKAEVHIEHPNNEYEHFKISCILGPNNIIEFIQKLRECRGLGYDKSLPTLPQLKSYDKTKENEKKIKLSNSKYEMLKLQIKNGKEE